MFQLGHQVLHRDVKDIEPLVDYRPGDGQGGGFSQAGAPS